MYSKIILGTAQWGTHYGISNINGQTSMESVNKILTFAHANNIRMIDTSPYYGSIQQNLGALDYASDFLYTSKLPKCKKSFVDADYLNEVKTSLTQTLSSLNTSCLDHYLVHDTDNLFLPNSSLLISTLNDFKRYGLVKNIGISVYSPSQLFYALDQCRFDTVQLPLSIFDQRFIETGAISKLVSLGIKIQVRSIFLQGLALMDAKLRPSYFDNLTPIFNSFDSICEKTKATRLSLAFSFVCSLPFIDHIVIGVESLDQLKEILSSRIEINPDSLSCLSVNDVNYVEPRLWPEF